MYGIHIIKTPSSGFIFVGSITAEMAYVMLDGSPADPATVERELILPASFRKIKTRAFDTKEEAERVLASFINS